MSSLKSNLKYSVVLQLFNILFGVGRVLIVPIILQVESYGYWQIYILYVGLVGVFALGYTDGIYLKYGGTSYKNLPVSLLCNANFFFVANLVFMLLITACFAFMLAGEGVKLKVYLFVLPNILISCILGYFSIIFQITNKIKQYSNYLVMDKFLFILFIFSYVLIGGDNFVHLILADIICKLVVLFSLLLNYPSIFLNGLRKRKISKRGCICYFILSKIGVKLLLANIVAILVLSAAKIFVEQNFTIQVFAYFSFGMALTNLGLMLVTSISVVLYPYIKMLNHSLYSKMFEVIQKLTLIFALFILLIYHLIYLAVDNLLPKYGGVFDYLNLLFIYCVLQARMQILLNLFYKVRREEKKLFYANIETLIIFVIFVLVGCYFLPEVYVVVSAFVLSILFRVIRTELYYLKVYSIKNLNLFYLIFLCIVFFFSTLTLNLSWSFFVTFSILVAYLALNFDFIKGLLNE